MPLYVEQDGVEDAFFSPFRWLDELPDPAHLAGQESLFALPSFELPPLKQAYHGVLDVYAKNASDLSQTAAFAHNALPLFEELPPASVSSLEDLSETPSPLIRTATSKLHKPGTAIDAIDLWQDPAQLPPLRNETRLVTWSTLLDPEARTQITSDLISEAGPAAFDAALEEHAQASPGNSRAGKAVNRHAFLDSLFELGLGHASVLFSIDSATLTVTRTIEDIRMTGTSLQASDSMIRQFEDVAGKTLEMRVFAHNVYADGNACAALVALAGCFRAVLDDIESYCVEQCKRLSTLVQLQGLFERPRELIATLYELYESQVGNDQLRSGALALITNDRVVSITFGSMRQQDEGGRDTGIIRSIFEQVSRPWLDDLETSVGLRPHSASAHVGIDLALPDFLSHEDAAIIRETGQCILYLKDYFPEHGFPRPEEVVDAGSRLIWVTEWDGLTRDSKAPICDGRLDTASNLLTDQKPCPRDPSNYEIVFSPKNGSNLQDPWSVDFESELYGSTSSMNGQTSIHSGLPGELHELVGEYLKLSSNSSTRNENCSQLPACLIAEYSLRPLLGRQHKVMTTAVLHWIFHGQRLREHLSTLHSFHLFGSGTFTSSLSHVLFDPDAELAERRKGVARGRKGILGLQLGSGKRREWPPTSSELSLALMDLLDNCRSEDTTGSRAATRGDGGFSLASVEADAPRADNISFALRDDLPPDTIERVLDADSIYALDFLKLSYTPPPALAIVLTGEALEKFDRIFKLMLRLLRVKFVVGQLFTDVCLRQRRSFSTRAVGQGDNSTFLHIFRYRVTHFLDTIVQYIKYASIDGPWQDLITVLTRFESSTHCGETSTEAVETATSRGLTLGALQHIHTATLNRILDALFLRHRQRKLAILLEELLSDILEFARILRRDTPDPNAPGDNGAIKILYKHFNERLRMFMEALQEAADRAESGKNVKEDAADQRRASKQLGEGFIALKDLLK